MGECIKGKGLHFLSKKLRHLAMDCTTISSEQKRISNEVFVMTKREAKASPLVILGKIYIYDIFLYALIDYSTTHSFISLGCLEKLDKPTKGPDVMYYIIVPSGDIMYSSQGLRFYQIQIIGKELVIDITLLNIQDFDIILGMD